MAAHNETGKKGEAAAALFLQKEGHTVLAQNFRSGRGEIDLITLFNNQVVFTEVKTRSSGKYGLPEEAVSAAKKRLLIQTAEQYLLDNKLTNEIRFDIISVSYLNNKEEIHWIQDAFWGYEE